MIIALVELASEHGLFHLNVQGGVASPAQVFYGGCTPLVLDRLAVTLTGLAALWLLNGESLARHLTAGRVRRGEG
ncbi:MAG: hypothetical protein ACR2MN_07915 [Acidimicrobiales bacterium]